ncbi:MAG: TetR family transcriptional regulator [Mycobacterium sp.]|nr:TetR family transcriptional regulator [Mycobacterium sp.]
MIDVAVKLCLEQGYERTTVDQIAAEADVSPRTFSRYFATKDAVYMALIEDLVEAAGAELRRIPPEVPVLQALRDAHVAVLRRIDSDGGHDITDAHVARMLKVINSTPELKRAAAELEPTAIGDALAERLGMRTDDRRLRLARGVWTAIIVTGCGDLVAPENGRELGPGLMADRIMGSFADFAEMTAALR